MYAHKLCKFTTLFFNNKIKNVLFLSICKKKLCICKDEWDCIFVVAFIQPRRMSKLKHGLDVK